IRSIPAPSAARHSPGARWSRKGKLLRRGRERRAGASPPRRGCDRGERPREPTARYPNNHGRYGGEDVSAEQGPRRQGGDATAANGIASRQRGIQTITAGTEART